MDQHNQLVLPNDLSGIMTISSSVQRCIKNGRDPIIQQRAKAIISMKLMMGYCLKGNSHVCTRCLMPLMVKRPSSITHKGGSDGQFPDPSAGGISGKGVCVVCPEIYKIKEQDNELFERMFVRHAGIHAKNSLMSHEESEGSSFSESEVDSARAEEESVDDDSSYDSEEFGEDYDFDYDGEGSDASAKYPRCEACGMDITDGDPHGNRKCHFCVVANGMHSVYRSQATPYFAFENSLISYVANPEEPRREEESSLRLKREDEIFQSEIQGRGEMKEAPEKEDIFRGEPEAIAAVEDEPVENEYSEGGFEKSELTESVQHAEDEALEREVEKPAMTEEFPVQFEIDASNLGTEVEMCPKQVEDTAESVGTVASGIPEEVIIDTNVESIKTNLKEMKDASGISAEEVLTKLIAKFWLRNGKAIQSPKQNQSSMKPLGPDTEKNAESTTRRDDRTNEPEDPYSALRSCKVSQKAMDAFKLIFEPSDISLSSDESTIEIVLHDDKTAEKGIGRTVTWKDHTRIEAEESTFDREDPPMGDRGMDPPSTCGECDGSVSLESRNNPNSGRSIAARDPSPTREIEEKIMFPGTDDEIRRQLMEIESKFREEDDVIGSDGTLTNMLIRDGGSGARRILDDDRTDVISSMGGSVSFFEHSTLSKVAGNQSFLYEKEVIHEDVEEESAARIRNIFQDEVVVAKDAVEEECAWNDNGSDVSRGEEFYSPVKTCDRSIAVARNELSPSALARRRHYKEMLLRQRRAQSVNKIAQE